MISISDGAKLVCGTDPGFALSSEYRNFISCSVWSIPKQGQLARRSPRSVYGIRYPAQRGV